MFLKRRKGLTQLGALSGRGRPKLEGALFDILSDTVTVRLLMSSSSTTSETCAAWAHEGVIA